MRKSLSPSIEFIANGIVFTLVIILIYFATNKLMHIPQKKAAVNIISDVSGKINLRVCCEFGYDLQCAAPYAYWLLQNGKLGTTIGAKGSSALYYFNEKYHIEDEKCERNDGLVPDQMNPHRISDFRKWSPPQYKVFFRNNVFVYDVPMLIIHNKYAPEWRGPPVNFLNIIELETLFLMLKDKYKIIYHRPKLMEEMTSQGNSYHIANYAFDRTEMESLKKYNVSSLPDDVVIRRYNITTLDDLAQMHPEYTFNEVQFMVHANADRFISVQGGNAVIASFFDGINIIYCKRGIELRRAEYKRLYPKFSKVKIIHASDTNKLLRSVKENFL